jgi:flagellar basal body-associated protein FliL
MPAIIAIAIALVAVAVAIAAWFKPAPKAEVPAGKTYTEQETADAKKAVCEAYLKTEQALNVNAQRAGSNPSQDLAVIANTRITIQAAAYHLHQALSDSSATPTELAKLIRDLANRYEAMLLDQIREADQAQLQSDYEGADAVVARISPVCNE